MVIRTLFNFDFFLNVHLLFNMENIIPTYQIEHLFQIQHILNTTSIEGIIFDIDQTIVSFGETEIKKETSDFIQSLRNKYHCCILSNFPQTTMRIKRIKHIEDQLGIKAILSNKKKPSPDAFHSALTYLDTKIHNTLMVGDRIFTDITGANNIGMLTALVNPINRKKDPFFVVSLPRFFEEYYLRIAQYIKTKNK